MNQPPKVIIRDSYNDFLDGKEVRATLTGSKHTPITGERVMAFKHTIAAETDVTVPKSQQSHYIGIEGTITGIRDDVSVKGNSHHPVIMVKKV